MGEFPRGDSRPVDRASRLLVVRLSALGDVVHTIPAVAALRDSFAIDWVVETPYRELVEIVAQVRAIPVSLKRWSISNIRSARRAIRGHGVAIDFQGLIKSGLVARLSGAAIRYGFHREFIREGPAAWLVNRHVDVDPSSHVVEWNMAVARSLANDRKIALHGSPSSELRDEFRRFAAGEIDASGSIVLLPGAGRAEKLWPVDRFRELAATLGERALAVWGPGEEERARAIGCRVAPRTNLRELARLLSTAAVVVGADTGPLHLAAALGTPVVGLYGPTNPRRNGPYGQIDCCVSTHDGSRSMEGIAVGAVREKIDGQLVRGRPS